jgi:osmotically-inducible protein OsmY
VKTALAKEAGLGSARDINVTTNRGTVQLSGFVDSREVANRAAQAARSVEGVQSVKNDIQVAAQGGAGASSGASRPGDSAPAGR